MKARHTLVEKIQQDEEILLVGMLISVFLVKVFTKTE